MAEHWLRPSQFRDGEIVALDEQGHPHFEWLENPWLRGVMLYYVFDPSHPSTERTLQQHP